MLRDVNGNDYLERCFSCQLVSDLSLFCCGKRIHSINHVYRWKARDCFFFSLIREGKATLFSGEDSYSVKENTLLILFPNSPDIYYKSDPGTPFSASWIGAYGSIVPYCVKQIGVTRERPFIHLSDPEALNAVIEDIWNYNDNGTIMSDLYIIGKTYEFFSVLCQEIRNLDRKSYVESAMEYMSAAYTRGITSGDVARCVGLDRSYFAMLFKRITGISPSTYLKNLRIKRSLELLLNTDMTIADISDAVGIRDEHYFSRIFTNVVGVSPSTYRKQSRGGKGD